MVPSVRPPVTDSPGLRSRRPHFGPVSRKSIGTRSVPHDDPWVLEMSNTVGPFRPERPQERFAAEAASLLMLAGSGSMQVEPRYVKHARWSSSPTPVDGSRNASASPSASHPAVTREVICVLSRGGGWSAGPRPVSVVARTTCGTRQPACGSGRHRHQDRVGLAGSLDCQAHARHLRSSHGDGRGSGGAGTGEPTLRGPHGGPARR